MGEVEHFLNICRGYVGTPPQKAAVVSDNTVECGGRYWNRDTGIQLPGVVFVRGYEQSTKPSFTRYDRRVRFLFHVHDYMPLNARFCIMECFDTLLKRWEAQRHSLTRKYFLNIRVLLFLIPHFLGMPTYCGADEVLRDKSRFLEQQAIFDKLMS